MDVKNLIKVIDYIDRDQVLEILNKKISFCCEPPVDKKELELFLELKVRIKDLMSIDAEEVKYGEWKKIGCGTICTNCNKVYDNDFEFPYKTIIEHFKRCPECGARMKQIKENK